MRTAVNILLLVSARAAIDRRAVVARHALPTTVANASLLSPEDVFTIGNGDFAVNVDATGLQTFNASFATTGNRLDLNTLASWAWHSTPYGFPNSTDPAGFLRAMNWSYLTAATSANNSRVVPYLVSDNNTSTNGGWTSGNPHRAGLGQVSLRAVLAGAALGDDPAPLLATAVVNLTSALDTWAGGVSSSFTLLTTEGTSPFCASSPETGAPITLSCALAHATLTIVYADYGAGSGACPTFTRNATCSAANATAIAHAACDGRRSCSLLANDGEYGDPCRWTRKRLNVVAACSAGGGSSSTSPPDGAASAFVVTVATAVHPDVDLVATRVTCARTAGAGDCPTALRLALPYPQSSDPSANTWRFPDAHTSVVVANASERISILHTADDLALTIDCEWNDAAWIFTRTDAHAFALVPPPGAAAAVELSCVWAPAGLAYPIGTTSSDFVRAKVAATRALLGGAARFPFYDDVQAAQAAMFSDYWQSASFVELAANGAADAFELERRVVLSRYLMRVNSAGASPPQETGLISNSWNGKFHLEMRFWHHSHWPVWGNSDLMARSWGFYFDLLPNATSLAAHQGYEGARCK